jgi:heme exporter protein D
MGVSSVSSMGGLGVWGWVSYYMQCIRVLRVIYEYVRVRRSTNVRKLAHRE